MILSEFGVNCKNICELHLLSGAGAPSAEIYGVFKGSSAQSAAICNGFGGPGAQTVAICKDFEPRCTNCWVLHTSCTPAAPQTAAIYTPAADSSLTLKFFKVVECDSSGWCVICQQLVCSWCAAGVQFTIMSGVVGWKCRDSQGVWGPRCAKCCDLQWFWWAGCTNCSNLQGF